MVSQTVRLILCFTSGKILASKVLSMHGAGEEEWNMFIPMYLIKIVAVLVCVCVCVCVCGCVLR